MRAITMCFNAFGLGALNIYFLVFGVLMGILNLMPFSLDCSAGMESWMGVPGYECTSSSPSSTSRGASRLYSSAFWARTGVPAETVR